MQTFEKVLEIFRDYLTLDLEEEVLKCSRGQFMVFAVNRPEQLPQPGHAQCSISLSSALSI